MITATFVRGTRNFFAVVQVDVPADKEDYTDWESVYDEEPEIEKRPKTKTSTVKREATKEDERLPSATPEDARRKDDERTRKLEPAAKSAASKAKPKASGNVKTQKGLMNFFGPSKKT